jgi:hypothetical protein
VLHLVGLSTHSKVPYGAHIAFVRMSEQIGIFALHNIKRLVFVTDKVRVYCAVRAGSLTERCQVSHLKGPRCASSAAGRSSGGFTLRWKVREFMLQPWSTWDLRSSVTLLFSRRFGKTYQVPYSRLKKSRMTPKDVPKRRYGISIILCVTLRDEGFGGLVVIMLASGTPVRGFNPGRSRWIFPGAHPAFI